MRRLLKAFNTTMLSVGVLALVAMPLRADNTDKDPQTPFIQTLNPDAAKPGDTIKVTGQYLGKSHVTELYLTQNGVDFKLQIKTQKADAIVANLPAKLDAGRYRLMVLTNAEVPRFIEQPVALNIE